jgi:glycosyltransferase involved in cell wall biosynthesis
VIYPDLDLAVVPSHSENCGGAVEPLLSGVAVVATNVGGLPDLIEDGETGWLVPPQKPEALARAMLDALQNREEAQRRTAEGQKLARCLFDVERVGHEIAGVYEKVLTRSARSNGDMLESIAQS